VVFEDETYYLESARWLVQSPEGLGGADLSNPYERMVVYFALAHLIGGDSTLWGRLLNTLIGALASVVIYDLIIKALGVKVQRYAWWFTALSPTLLIWSAFYLKEGLLLIGISLIVNAIVRIHKGRFGFKPLIMTTAGITICLWTRSTVLLPLFPPLILSIITIKSKSKSGMFLPVVIGLTIMVILTAFYPVRTAEWVSTLFSTQGLTIMYESVRFQEQEVELTFPFFSTIMQWHGAVRTVGFCFLLMISPVITSVWSLIPILGNLSWTSFAVAAYATSWWICLPFLARSIFDALKQRDTWWLVWGGVFILWSMVAGYIRLGAGYDAFRYRDILLPVIMLIAAKGLRSILSERDKRGCLSLVLKGYWVVVVALILLRGIGILRLI
jgi:hypothetical protein